MQHDKTSNEPLTEDRQGEVLLQDSIDPNKVQKNYTSKVMAVR